jgi:plasmid stabilization system protein ParE
MKIRWTQPAVRDLTQICDYIEEHDGPARARSVALTIYQTVESLEVFPRRGRLGRKPNTREVVVSKVPYLGIYRLRDDVVEILRILHGAQRWP